MAACQRLTSWVQAKGLAYAAREIEVPITVAVPEAAAQTKIDSLIELGASVIRRPFDEWWSMLNSRSIPGHQGLFIHPVAENAVLAGNATIGAEILEDLPECDTVLVPYGGGGLICGIGSVVKRLRPNARMIVIESEAAMPVAEAFRLGHPVKVPHRQSFVDGMGSSGVLPEMWPLVQQISNQALCVSFQQIADAIRLLALRHRIICEAAGAAAVAAALSGQAGGGNVVCVVSGGNLDVSKLSAILNGDLPF